MLGALKRWMLSLPTIGSLKRLVKIFGSLELFVVEYSKLLGDGLAWQQRFFAGNDETKQVGSTACCNG